MRAASFDEFGGLLGRDAHHRFVKGAVGGKIISERADNAGRAGGFGGVDGEAEFFERGLSFDDDGVDAGIDERGGLLIKRGASIGFGEIAVRFKNCAERADIAEDVTGTFAESFASDANAGLVDGANILVVTVAFEHERAAAEGVGDKTIGAGFDIAALHSENAFGMSEVPEFATIARFKAREHELGAHRAIANEAAFENGFAKRFFHGRHLSSQLVVLATLEIGAVEVLREMCLTARGKRKAKPADTIMPAPKTAKGMAVVW